ncbi:MAG: hypothetical protein J6B74_04835 [Ruminococcus sp.]|nr:hypothetical protein [Ruminococcus sp.]
MSTRELAINVIKSLSEEKLKAFLTLFADENMIARLEGDMLANDPNAKRYSSFQEFMDEMEQESE